ncbi:MAG: carbon monoxide dehydrogenase, partial [Chloroflexi bacterium]|nr:carbon monoxide dehydrogenase [Chloroflexota bacterium]
MKLSGTYEFDAPPEKVWQTLTSPDSLSACIPGCEKMESLGNDEYSATVT